MVHRFHSRSPISWWEALQIAIGYSHLCQRGHTPIMHFKPLSWTFQHRSLRGRLTAGASSGHQRNCNCCHICTGLHFPAQKWGTFQSFGLFIPADLEDHIMSSSWSWWRWSWQSRFLLCFVWSQQSTAVSRSAALNLKLLSHLTWWSEQTGSKRFVFVITWGRSCITLWGIPITRDLIITGICHYCLSLFTSFFWSSPLFSHTRVLILCVIVGTFSLSLRGSVLTMLWWVYEQWHL